MKPWAEMTYRERQREKLKNNALIFLSLAFFAAACGMLFLVGFLSFLDRID